MPQIQTVVRDAETLRAACRQLGLAEPVLGAFPLGSAVASGFAVRLPGWKYPVVFQLDAGHVQYEDPHGEQRELERLLDACAAEEANIEDGKECGAKASTSEAF